MSINLQSGYLRLGYLTGPHPPAKGTGPTARRVRATRSSGYTNLAINWVTHKTGNITNQCRPPELGDIPSIHWPNTCRGKCVGKWQKSSRQVLG